ncbi:MAG: hypothetical protein HUJ26_14405, partial [Planctomycetaceae bacterium]|nr:hypothetical protein [Planctomycetaceae bacterium]
VMFAGAGMAAAEIPAEYFSLDDRARAASWSSAGDAIGASPKTYAFLKSVSDAQPTEKKPTRPRSTSGF